MPLNGDKQRNIFLWLYVHGTCTLTISLVAPRIHMSKRFGDGKYLLIVFDLFHLDFASRKFCTSFLTWPKQSFYTLSFCLHLLPKKNIIVMVLRRFLTYTVIPHLNLSGNDWLLPLFLQWRLWICEMVTNMSFICLNNFNGGAESKR